MGFRLAEAYVELGTKGMEKVTAATDKIKTALGKKGLGGAADNVGTALAGAFGGVALAAATKFVDTITTGLMRALDTIIDLGKEAVSLGVGADATVAEFAVFVGDAGKAREILGDIEETFSGTTISADQAAEATKKLIFSGMTADKAVETVKRLGAVAAGSGDSITALADAYQRAAVRGEVTGRVLQQMPAVVEELKRMFPELGESIFDAAEKGQIGIDDFEAALTTLAVKGDKVLDAQRQSVRGLWDLLKGTLWDKFGGAMSQMTRPVLEFLRPLLADMLVFGTAFATTVKAIADYLAPVGHILGVLTSSTLKGLGMITQMTNQLVGLGSTLFSAWSPFLELLNFAADKMGKILDKATTLASLATPGKGKKEFQIDGKPVFNLFDPVGTTYRAGKKLYRMASGTDNEVDPPGTSPAIARQALAATPQGDKATQFLSFTALAEKMQMEAANNLDAQLLEVGSRTAVAVEALLTEVRDRVAPPGSFSDRLVASFW